MMLDLRDRGVVDERAKARLLVARITDDERAHPRLEARQEFSRDRRVEQEPVRRDAGLPHEAELREHRLVDRAVEVGVGKDEKRRVSAEFERGSQQARGALRGEDASDFRRAREGQLAGGRGIDERTRDRGRVADDHAERSGWRADFPRDALVDARECERGERRFLRRLHGLRATRSKRGRKLARDHRKRKVPRRDRESRANGLAQHEDPAVRRARSRHLARRHLGGRRRVVEEGGRVLDFAAALRDRLTALCGEHRRELRARRTGRCAERAGERDAALDGQSAHGEGGRSVRGGRPLGERERGGRKRGEDGVGRGVDDGERMRIARRTSAFGVEIGHEIGG